MVWSMGEPLLLQLLLRKGPKYCFTAPVQPGRSHPPFSVPVPQTATELNMLAAGERRRNGRGKEEGR